MKRKERDERGERNEETRKMRKMEDSGGMMVYGGWGKRGVDSRQRSD